ncbi:MAG: twin-arginine translocase subunit TatC [Bacillota bacterium]|nr:twin-arginine translocase subunit TatC [Bacillota bacterium]
MKGEETVESGKAPRDKQMSIIEHLEELRWRIIVSLLAVGAGSVLGWFWAPRLLAFLARDVGHFVFVSPTEAFFSYLRLAFTVGLILGLPVALVEAWLFILPGLYPHEVRFFARYVPLIVALFVLGVGFAYLAVYPVVLRFFLGFATEHIRPVMNVGRYLNFLTSLLLPFGLIFELPVLIVGLVKLGVVDRATLARGRRLAYLLAFVVGAVLTPPDVISQVMMALPLIVLYEFSLILVRGVRPLSESAEGAAGEAPTPDEDKVEESEG